MEQVVPGSKLGYDNAGLLSRISFGYVNPLLALGASRQIAADSAQPYLPKKDNAELLAAQFDKTYNEIRASNKAKGKAISPSRLLWATFFTVYGWRLFINQLVIFLEMCLRIANPLVLRQLLEWFIANDSDNSSTSPDSTSTPPPAWKGWVWASLIGILGYSYTLVHHQLFFRCMRTGLQMRQQAISAVQAKVLLRLNSVAVSDVTAGKIINLVSNDVRRFDDAAVYSPFLIGGPMELMVVLVLVGLRLGFAAAIAGVSTLLLLIPVQAFLGRYIGQLRHATAVQTDERVRLTGEAVSGMLAAKMMCLEPTLLKQIAATRVREAYYIRRMSWIRGMNMATTWCITPVCSLVTFAVARATNTELSVADVFYSLALLQLPKLSMCEFFVRGVEVISELRVSMRRLGAFLNMPEPPEPWHVIKGTGSKSTPQNGDGDSRSNTNNKKVVVSVNGADFDWSDRSWMDLHTTSAAAKESDIKHSSRRVSFEKWRGQTKPMKSQGPMLVQHSKTLHDQDQVVVQLPSSLGSNGTAIPSSALYTATAEDGQQQDLQKYEQHKYTLNHLKLDIQKGSLVAIVGAVGSGKSSLLAALLGELQPIWPLHTRHPSTTAAPAASRPTSPKNNNPAVDDNQDQDSLSSSVWPEIIMHGSVAYCSQIPWIEAGTVEENILFGQPMEVDRYQAVVRACALEEDLDAMPAGDQTEIGERGISLSGGQKARLALARAAYSPACLQLLDDPLSAVDPGVGRTLFDSCIGPNGLMKDSTRVLVTHQRQYLPACDRIIVLRHGCIAEQGSYEELVKRKVVEVVSPGSDDVTSVDVLESTADAAEKRGGSKTKEDASRLPKNFSAISLAPSASATSLPTVPASSTTSSSQPSPRTTTTTTTVVDNTALVSVSRFFSMRRLGSTVTNTSTTTGGGVSTSFQRQQSTGERLRRLISRKTHGSQIPSSTKEGEDGGGKDEDQEPGRKGEAAGKLVRSEDQAVGSVSWKVYGEYARYMGFLPVTLIALGLFGGQAVFLFGDYWLAQWASKPPEEQQKDYWVWGYACFVAGIVTISISRSLLFFTRALGASSTLHTGMAEQVMHAPLSFFHTNPSGRILNRFSKDQGAMDEQLPQVMFDSLQAGMMVLGAFTLLVIVVPFILPVFVPLGIAFVWIQRRYLLTSRELKRFEAVTRSPLYSIFSATIKGLPTIRAYNVGVRFRREFLRLLSSNCAWQFCWITSARWTGFRLDFLVALLLTAAPLLMMAVHDSLSPRLVGLALTQSLQLAGMLQWMVRQCAEVENNMTSVERMLEYSQLDQEPKTVDQGGKKPPPQWPVTGHIRYENVTAIYRVGLAPVLNNLTFTIPGGVSCGVVGRTGSGKSSLVLTLFRLIPITEGHITLDGLDTSSIGLDALRKQIAVIPQDPVLFSGTLRSNLDPWGLHGDAELWEALRTAQLVQVVQGLGGLDQEIKECGDNLSVGQRQLLCLARALLQDAAVLALDEATANVDRATDALIQAAVKQACSHRRRSLADNNNNSSGNGAKRTLVVIAHRLDTIMDCDQLLVLGGGRLLETGPPQDLAQQGGTFGRMVKAARAASKNIGK